MFDLSIQWLISACDASLKALLLGLAAAALLRVLRVRDSNLRHRVWIGVLGGMLALPFLAQVVPALRLPFAIDRGWIATQWEADLTQPQSAKPLEIVHALPEPTATTPATDNAVDAAPTQLELDLAATEFGDDPLLARGDARMGSPSWRGPAGVEVVPQSTASDFESAFPEEQSSHDEAKAAPQETSTVAVVPPHWSQRLLARWPLLLMGAWLAGFLVLMLRLAMAFLGGLLLLRKSQPLAPEELIDVGLDESCLMLHGRNLRLLECSRIRVPVTLGLIRPRILLPLDWMEWPAEKLQAVIAHERTHVERRDCAAMLLAEINRCVYWFHPLSWWLRRELSRLAEQACDDAAIGAVGDRTSYARHLLEVASAVSRQRGRVIHPGVSMARRANVESRIHSILDFTRPLSKRLSPAMTWLLLGCTVPAIAIAAALRPAGFEQTDATQDVAEVLASEDPSTRDVLAVADDTVESATAAAAGDATPIDATVAVQAADTDKATSAKEDQEFLYQGTVVNHEGNPVVDAKILLSYWRKSAPPVDAAPLAVTDREGRFQFSRRKSDFADGGEDRSWTYAQIVATNKGYGFASGYSIDFDASGQLKAELNERERQWLAKEDRKPVLRLVEDVPVRGRIVNTEGQPAAGATISAINISEGKEGSLDAWEAATQEPQANFYSARMHLKDLAGGNFIDGPQATVVPPVQTDADGWFELHGLGRDRIAECIISGPGIESGKVYVRARDGEIIKLARSERGDDLGDDTYYPNGFTHVCGPSQPVVGRVTDRVTGEPMAGIVLRGDRIASHPVGGTLSAGFIRTVTDADGRYRLEGFPLGENEFLILPPPDAPHLMGSVSITTSADQPELVRDIELTPGVMVRGRVVDGVTGEPARGYVQSFAFTDNPHLKDAPTFGNGDFRHHYWTDADGRFAIPVLPGPGILAFNADDHEKYPRGAGEESIKGPKEGSGLAFYRTQPSYCIPKNHHFLAPLDFEPGAGEQTLNITLGSGATIPGRIVDAGGQPVSDCYLYGENGYSSWYSHEATTFTVNGYFPREGRRLMAWDPATNEAGEVEITGEAPESVEIVLRPAGKITGRVLDDDGEPLAGGMLINDPYRGDSKHSDRGSLITRQDGKPLATDAQGRFEFAGLLPGRKYSAGVQGLRTFGDSRKHLTLLGTIFEDVTVQPGETKDLGDVTIQSRDRDTAELEEPKAAPVAVESATSSPPTAPVAATSAARTESAPRENVTVRGVVLLPDGSPAAGAAVRSAPQWWDWLQSATSPDYRPPFVEARADVQGRFELSIPLGADNKLTQSREAWEKVWRQPRWQVLWKQTRIAASHPGYGGAWVTFNDIDDRNSVQLQLVEDLPIRGRVIDLEGRPVAGVTVKLSNAAESLNRDLTPWLEAVEAGEPPWTAHTKAGDSVEPRLIDLPEELKTDADGRFEIHGVGKERKIELTFLGETAAHRSATAVTRDMSPTSRAIISHAFNGSEVREPVFGAEFSFTADPARTIEGIVTDADTGDPLQGVSIESYKLVGYPYGNHRVLKSTTDAAGRFRIVGMPKGTGNILLAVPSDGVPYMMRRVEVPDPVGLGPAKMEIELHRGVLIEGQVTDKSTGEAVPGVRMHYLPLRSNEFAQALPEFDDDGNVDGDQMRYQTDAEGRFQLIGLPGAAIIGAESAFQDYRLGVGYDELTARKYGKSDWIDTYRNPINPGPKWPSSMRQVDIPEDAGTFQVDLELDPGASVDLKIVDADGAPVTGVSIDGLSSRSGIPATQEPVQTAVNFGPNETRTIIVQHREQRLGRVAKVGPEDVARGEATIVVEPTAKVRGTLWLDDTTPASGLTVEPRILPGGDFSKQLATVATDAQGRFEAELLVGCEYNLFVQGGGLDVYALAADQLSVQPGESRDLGDLVLAKDRKFEPLAQAAEQEAGTAQDTSVSGASTASSASAASDQPQVTLRGRITVHGQPASDADVAAVAWKLGAAQGGDLSSRGEVLGETKTNAQGDFELKLTGVSSQTHRDARIIARHADSALGWKILNLDEASVDATINLMDAEPIRGRLIDTEGQPAMNVKVSLRAVMRRDASESNPDGAGFYGEAVAPRAWPQSVITDDEGRFTINGIPADCGVYLAVAGSDRFAEQDIALNTGMPEQRGERDGTYRPLVRNVEPGEEAVLVLSPAQVFEGSVTFEDTGEPAVNAPVNIWASQQEYGSMTSVAGRTDARGRYRINPHPGIRFGVTAYPPEGTPYLIRSVSRISRDEGEDVKQVDIKLPRGVLVRGKVIEAESKQPIAGATVQYEPKQNNPFNTDDIITGWQGMQLSDEEGNFEIAVMPGRGTLLFHGPDGEFVLQEISSRELSSDKPGGRRNYAHAIHPLDLQEGAEPVEQTIELQRGAEVHGRLVDEFGAPIDKALMITRLHIVSHSPYWRGFPEDVSGGEFHRADLAPGEEYPVHFLEPERRLGATVLLTSDELHPTVTLKPCGEATARFVDVDGNPVADHRASLEIVVTPGSASIDFKAMQMGQITADSDFVANVDRKNHWDRPGSDADGSITFPALIPGATYRLNFGSGEAISKRDFSAESGRTIDLGDIVVKADE
jgi:beta-lactamase regulating signal transducer with metallopeptidase domain/protocatechuate 3,4-dioxygenase beta subunit/5-hydroxyisourate hydrolase-like protein (transthyretin family)